MALDVKDFGFLSEGVTERVIFVKEGSTPIPTVLGANSVDITVPDTSELMMVRASVSLDGVSWYSEDSPRYSNGSTGTDLSVSSYSAPSRIRLFFVVPSGTTTVYYRAVGLKVV